MPNRPRKFAMNEEVVWSDTVPCIHGELAGTVIGYYNDFFPILLLKTPHPTGERAEVVHASVLSGTGVCKHV